MKILTFLARRFAYRPSVQTLPDAPPAEGAEVADAVVAFVHVEGRDEPDEARARAVRMAGKHLKWLANKRELKNVVLHSFTHLGGENADPRAALAIFDELAERLRGTGYSVWITPFGYSCEWELSVHGETLAKVWKEI
jgi:hypothetical protein